MKRKADWLVNKCLPVEMRSVADSIDAVFFCTSLATSSAVTVICKDALNGEDCETLQALRSVQQRWIPEAVHTAQRLEQFSALREGQAATQQGVLDSLSRWRGVFEPLFSEIRPGCAGFRDDRASQVTRLGMMTLVD